MQKQIKNKLLLMLLILCWSITSYASHIIGGEFTYTYQGNNVYRITLTIYQDCLTGNPSAIQQDNPAKVTIFEGDGNIYLQDATLVAVSSVLIPSNFSNSCITNIPNTCLRKTVFVKDYILPSNTLGYRILYQRCCRNATILNIDNPGTTGASYYCDIPPLLTTGANNSAIFKVDPPQIICVNVPFVYDHAATDADGDSLSYNLCEAYIGGSQANSSPMPTSIALYPVNYSVPYTYDNPIQGNPGIQIDAVSGLMYFTPTIQGRYVVTVCCNEWRNGVIINTSKREFQFVITNCYKTTIANIPQFSSDFNTYLFTCTTKEIKFKNTSIGGNTYHWDFGVTNTLSDTSNLLEPTFTYPDTGTYTVKLIVNPKSTCSDSITRLVKVYPFFKSDFSITGNPCPNAIINLNAQITNSCPPTSFYNWYSNGTLIGTSNTAATSYAQSGKYNIQLVAGNSKGCRDSINKDFIIDNFIPFAGNDTIIVVGEQIQFNATGGVLYSWTPSTYLNLNNLANPVGYYPILDTIQYTVNITSSNGCTGTDDIIVRVVKQGAYFMPSGFTPNNDGINDRIRPILIGYSKLNYFSIYNRWGELIFNSKNINDSWDGTYKDQKCEMGTYYYIISVTDKNNKTDNFKGDITLLR
ncbi:MAG: gliding motility-associated C-terminal domain-containing protein [Bacteroidota bacterium]|jgi:gliding motility-associated-like protein|nr:gliding motility-associated C-terminal domain-containing protein [Bacteroidota bacterium]